VHINLSAERMYLTAMEMRNLGMGVSLVWEDDHSVLHWGFSCLILGKFVSKITSKILHFGGRLLDSNRIHFESENFSSSADVTNGNNANVLKVDGSELVSCCSSTALEWLYTLLE
jgi:hypothetical protein